MHVFVIFHQTLLSTNNCICLTNLAVGGISFKLVPMRTHLDCEHLRESPPTGGLWDNWTIIPLVRSLWINRTHAFFRLQRTVSIQSVPQPQNTHAAGKVAGTCHGCVRPLSDSDSNRSAARTPNLSYDFRRELFAKGFSQGLSFTSSHGEALGHVVKCIIPTQFQFFWHVKTNEAEILHIDIGRDVHFSPRTCI